MWTVRRYLENPAPRKTQSDKGVSQTVTARDRRWLHYKLRRNPRKTRKRIFEDSGLHDVLKPLQNQILKTLGKFRSLQKSFHCRRNTRKWESNGQGSTWSWLWSTSYIRCSKQLEKGLNLRRKGNESGIWNLFYVRKKSLTTIIVRGVYIHIHIHIYIYTYLYSIT